MDKIPVVFDITEMKVGCALLQAALGGDESVCRRVDAKHWLVEITPGMKVYQVTPEQFGVLVSRMESLR